MIMGISKRFNGTQLEQELTKPCPLMPDGEWVKTEIHVTVTDNVFHYTSKHSTDVFGEKFIVYSSIADGSEVTATTAINLRLKAVNPCIFGEVRQSVVMNVYNTTTAIDLHGASTWRIENDGQHYYVLPNTQISKLGDGTDVDLVFYLYSYILIGN